MRLADAGSRWRTSSPPSADRRPLRERGGEAAAEKQTRCVSAIASSTRGCTPRPPTPLSPPCPRRGELPPYLSFAPLDNAVDGLNRTAERYERAFAKASERRSRVRQADVQALTPRCARAERALLSATGLPRRPWYRHQIYATGSTRDTAVQDAPGVREAIEQKNWSEAEPSDCRHRTGAGRHTGVVARGGGAASEARALSHG